MEFPVVAFIALFVVSCSAADTSKVKERPCNLAFKCSLQDDPTWCTNGKKCFVFRNPCLLANENCQRQNRYEPVLEVISKEECQALCTPLCPKNRKPVCGYYNEEKREFSNKCLMDYHICNTGQTFMIYNEGRCEEPLTLATK